MALRHDRPRPGPEEPRGVVVHAGDGLAACPLRQARLGVAARVAQVGQHDDGIGGEVEILDERLAEVLVGPVVYPGDGVEPEAILGGREELVAVAAGEAVAVPQVDDDRGAGGRGPDGRPGGVG